MFTIVQRGGASREKPPEVVRGYSSRLPWAWDGLCFAVPFNDATQDAARDLVANAAPSAVNGLTWVRDNRGNSAGALTILGQYMDYADNPQHNRPTTGLTAYVRMRRSGQGSASGGIFCKVYDAAVDPLLSWGIYHSDVVNNAVQGHLYVPAMGPYINVRDPYVLSTTQWVGVFFRWASGMDPRIDILGERGETLSSSTYGSTYTGSIGYVAGLPIGINRAEVNTNNAYADYSQAMLWSRRLTDTELQALVADPYGWYSPRRSTVITSNPYGLPFGGGEMRGGTGQAGGLH